MKVKVLLFAHTKEIVGQEAIILELDEGSTEKDVFEKLESMYPKISDVKNSFKLAMNGQYITDKDTIIEGAELAVITPVSGG